MFLYKKNSPYLVLGTGIKFVSLRLDSADWALCCTSTTINTCIRIDIVLAVAFANSIYWTYTLTCTTCNTFTVNLMSHDRSPFIKIHILYTHRAVLSTVLQNLSNCKYYFLQAVYISAPCWVGAVTLIVQCIIAT